ncbi:4-alpha-glucanotransferase [Lacimicrobium alkaliphilum]|uniref:4-alpha-glucanotransferase n=1 Tax=Lacimicrobium alkaliphilum TaxID=1526571 RepID=A0ABQ1RAT6_9ALTE|nr:4-alpha-glucanotransferase [Lacimicrobium alkaliphilum]GGD64209.1 4-alpha-glucanotransferase [Lacimicrobium alkaliphilum]
MKLSLVDQLAEMRGIESNYIDAWGKPMEVEPQSKVRILEAMGYVIEDEQKLQQQLGQESEQAWLEPLDPVLVKRQGEQLVLALRLPIELVNDEMILRIVDEQGALADQRIVASDGVLIDATHIQDGEFQEYLIEISTTVEQGYHQLRLLADDEDEIACMRLIIAPPACYKPDAIKKGDKVWGLSVQLYCLRSERNWGVGDFSDLCFLLGEAAERGAQFVGLNPIHALYPANPDACSPYGPSSRRWLNFIYLDVSAIEGYGHPEVQKLISSGEFQARLGHLRDADYVDYQGVMALKLEALNLLFEHYNNQYLKGNTRQNRAFKAFVDTGGESLQILACYDALQAHLKQQGKDYWGWPVFPEAVKQYGTPQVEKFKKTHSQQIKFFLFLQWQASIQLENAHKLAAEKQMCIGIYRDLAVGVSEGGAEIWGNQSLYATDASVGAPPDILGPLGQDWGLPPMDPKQLYRQQYQPVIDLFRSNMQSCGALRIDHVMALLRLWWVPKGNNAKTGSYVYYPVDDLLAILALESERNKVLVIGEDLGTVPEEIRETLTNNGVYSYRVFFFEQAKDGGFFSPSHYPEQSMATLTTHDMPTLTGYWHCLDLELGKTLNLYPSEEILRSLYDSRHNNKQRILDSLHAHGSIPDWIGREVEQVGMSKELNHGLQMHMASGSSALLSLQLEDWLEMDKPVNVPGTYSEYPNWQRKLSKPLESVFSRGELQDLARGLTERRKHVSEGD